MKTIKKRRKREMNNAENLENFHKTDTVSCIDCKFYDVIPFHSWYLRPDLNRHELGSTDFKSVMSTNSITQAL